MNGPAEYRIDAWADQRAAMTAPERRRDDFLTETLALAVPLWVDRYAGKVSWEEARRRARICVEHLMGPGGEDVLYASARRGGSAEAFNRLAEAVAIASFQPGGITVFGRHFESHPPFLTLDEILADDREVTP